MTSLPQPTICWDISPGFCTSNSLDPRVNNMEASHSNLHTSTTPNVTSGSGFHEGMLQIMERLHFAIFIAHWSIYISIIYINNAHVGSLYKGYIQEAASRMTPIYRNMQGIEQIVSKMNSSPEQASSITVCSNEDVCSVKKSSYSGSILQSSSRDIIQPSPEHHTKIPTSNHGTVLVLFILVLICYHYKVLYIHP